MSKTSTKTVVCVGLDLGTNASVFRAARDGKMLSFENDVFPSLVGYAKQGIIPGILPTDGPMLFGEQALEYRLHLDLKWPLKDGFVDDMQVAMDYANFLCGQIDAKGSSELWGVVGAPATASEQGMKDIRAIFAGVFARILTVPEPFLAAMGLRDDDRVKNDPSYVDPTKNSLIVDIGAGTTDCCLVQGYYPGSDDQFSVPIAGDAVDQAMADAIAKRFPDIKLTRVTITKMKEKHSFVGRDKSANVKIYVDGKPKTVDFGEIVREACEVMVAPILEGVRSLLARCDSEAVEHILGNIIIAGGGSQIAGLPEQIQKALRDEGYDGAKTSTAADYRHLVANGAIKIATSVREDQWQVPM